MRFCTPHSTTRCLSSAIAVFSISISSQCPHSETRYSLSAVHRANIRAETLTSITRVEDLPATVREALREHFSGRSLANPGEPFHSNLWQVVRMPHAAQQRLIAAGCSADHCLIHYEEGGYHHSFRLVLFGLNRHDAQIEWVGTPAAPLPDVTAMKSFALPE